MDKQGGGPSTMHRLAFVAVCLVTIVLSPAPLSGQEIEPYFQFHAGPKLCTVSHRIESYEEDWIEDDFRLGYSVGGIFGVAFAETRALSLESGLLYQRRGGDSNLKYPMYDMRGNVAGWHSTELNWKFTYLTIPIFARASLGGGRDGPYIKVGPELGILLSAKYERPGYPQFGEVDERVEEDVETAITPIDISLFLGGGVNIPVGRTVMFVELGYSHGLRDVYEAEDAYEEEELRNRMIGLSVGVIL
jgi:hypothetical protein